MEAGQPHSCGRPGQTAVSQPSSPSVVMILARPTLLLSRTVCVVFPLNTYCFLACTQVRAKLRRALAPATIWLMEHMGTVFVKRAVFVYSSFMNISSLNLMRPSGSMGAISGAGKASRSSTHILKVLLISLGSSPAPTIWSESASAPERISEALICEAIKLVSILPRALLDRRRRLSAQPAQLLKKAILPGQDL